MTADPVLIAYTVRRSSRTRKAHWARIGYAYAHDTGAGLTVVLDSVPLDGIIVLLERDAEDDLRLAKQDVRRSAKPETSRS